MIAKWDRENREKQARRLLEEEQEDTLHSSAPGNQDSEIKPASAMMEFADGPAMNAPNTTTDMRPDATGRTSLDILGRPTFLLTLDQAAELAMINAREFQDARENLYLAALPVTQERFSFSTQLFAASEAVRDYSGASATNSGSSGASVKNTSGSMSNNWSVNNGTGLSKVLPTGASAAQFFQPNGV